MAKDPQQLIKGPATALIVSGSLNGVLGFLSLLGGVLRLLMGMESLPQQEAERIGFLAGTVIGYLIAFASLLVAPVVVYAGYRMLNGRSYRLSKIAALLSILPLTSCCFLVGVPTGIWALVILYKPEVRSYFEGESGRIAIPPEPPSFQ